MKKKGNLEIVILVCGTDLMMFPHNYIVDIVLKEWYKFVDLFYKLFLIIYVTMVSKGW